MGTGIIVHAALVLPEGVRADGTLCFDVGKITTLVTGDYGLGELQQHATALEPDNSVACWDLQGDYLIPGLIDMHVHGAGGHDVMDGTPASMLEMSKNLLHAGTVAFLPTTLSGSPDCLSRVLANISTYKRVNSPTCSDPVAEVLGVHLEGPFLTPEFAGAQSRGKIWPLTRPGAPDYLRRLTQTFPDLIRILTLAPERPDAAALTRCCLATGIIPAVGHSGADYEVMLAALGWGIQRVTHAFNAMPALHQRNPGLLTAALNDKATVIELIADGIHIHPAVLELALKLKGPDRVCLVSDATRAMGMPDGCYELGGNTTTVYGGIPRLEDGTLAGSACSLLQGIRNLVHKVHCPLATAVNTASLNPARQLGVEQRLGSLTPGKDATFIRLSPQLELKQIWYQGNLVRDQMS
ncbi:MAG: N-acetylglucosamine-6-phosphate deacetylase [Peptococcaceae bacterium]|nr:N-acetylglucosamine-6-phosphate deacetylase [Peptococcaceae bacterium]